MQFFTKGGGTCSSLNHRVLKVRVRGCGMNSIFLEAVQRRVLVNPEWNLWVR